MANQAIAALTWPDWLLPILAAIADNNLGNLASVAGVGISLVGFGVTMWNTWRSKSAAERAEAAAHQVRRTIRTYETVSEFSAAVTLMEEIRRLHRSSSLEMLPDRYAALRKTLINIRVLQPNLDDEHQIAIQTALSTLSAIETTVERCRIKAIRPDMAKINRLMSRDIDSLQAVLIKLKLGPHGE